MFSKRCVLAVNTKRQQYAFKILSLLNLFVENDHHGASYVLFPCGDKAISYKFTEMVPVWTGPGAFGSLKQSGIFLRND